MVAKTFPNHSFDSITRQTALFSAFWAQRGQDGVFEELGQAKRNLRRSGPDRLGENAFEVFGS